MMTKPDEIVAQIEGEDETVYEALANTLIYTIATVLAATATALLLVLASSTESAKVIVACAIYGATVFLAFLFGALYHGIWHGPTKAVFLALDHCSIFMLIAGTYTPVALLLLPNPLGLSLFVAVWLFAAAGIALRLWIGHLHWTMIPIFVVMGWLGMYWGDTIFTRVGNTGGWLLLAGGLAYSAGLGFFLWRRLPFNHAIWHGCVVAGAACHFMLIVLYAVPHVP